MPKKKLGRVKGELPKVPNVAMSAPEQAAYSDLLEQVKRCGNERNTSVEILVVAAKQKALLASIDEELSTVGVRTVRGANGQLMVHPLVKEQRQLQITFCNTLGKLLLTTRSKSVARLKEDAEGDLEDSDNPILKICKA